MNVRITGNTYPVRERLKALGCRWDAAGKCWLVPENKADQARAIIAAAPAPQRRAAETRRCWECGCDFTYAECRRSGGNWGESYCGC